jgi:integrating conjugative element protein (TIGR03765 family)
MLETLKIKKNIFFMLLFCAWTTGVTSAEPIVIRDYGGRDSGVPTKETLQKTMATQAPNNKVRPPAFGDEQRYPIHSKLRAGYLSQPQKLREPVKGAQPFFIVSNDGFSRDWLVKNKAYLLKIGAQGLATNLDNKIEFTQLKNLAKPLPLVAVPVDEIANILSVSVYPVLITGEEIAK